MTANARKVAPRRRYARIPMSGIVYFRTGSALGKAMLADASLSGICIVSPHRFSAGQRIMIATVPSSARRESDNEMKGVVTWCIPTQADGGFRVGIRIYRADEATEHALHELVQSSLRSKRMVALSPLEIPAAPTDRQTSDKTLDTRTTWFTLGPEETLVKHAAAAGM